MLPNFLGVGAQKSGTTTLYDILKNHPDIYLPRHKEAHFFDSDRKYKKGLSFYEKRYFSEWNGESAVGEITPIYMYLEYVPKRIYESLGPDVKLIFILRNPVDRAYSHYWMTYRRGLENESFEKAIELEAKRLKDGGRSKYDYSYVSRGMYAKQIKNFLRYFSMDNFLILIFEDFVKDIPGFYQKICRFLGVNPELNIPESSVRSNPARISKLRFLQRLIRNRKITKIIFPHKKLRRFIRRKFEEWNLEPFKPPRMPDETRKKLLEIFLPDIVELEKIIGRDLSIWKNQVSQ